MYQKNYNGLLLILMFSFMISACEEAPALQGEEVQIRVENVSSLAMENIRVSFPDEVVDYGSLKPGEKTEYETLPKAYRYQAIEMTIEGKQARLQPIDFVGEELLDKGRYTYQLDINEEIFESDPEFSVILSLVED